MRGWTMAVVALLALVLPAGAMAQSRGATPVAGVLEPEAAAAIDRMAAYLRTLGTFEVRADATTETVYDNGQKLQYLQRVTYTVRNPTGMRIDLVGDRTHRQFWYDGTTMTVVAVKAGKYTRFPVAGTNAEVLGRAADDYGLSLPLLDLFRWGGPADQLERPESGFRVGEARIGDVVVDHYAFRQAGVDFQLWLERGERPLPRKLVITNTENPAQPQYVAYLTWNLAPRLDSARFAFRPEGMQLVDFGAAKAAARAR